MKAIEIFCHSASGIYIPQRFAREVNRELVTGITDDDYAVLESGPDHEWYWETWDMVEQNAVLTLDGNEFRLYQDGDLFVICDELITDEEYVKFFGVERDE